MYINEHKNRRKFLATPAPRGAGMLTSQSRVTNCELSTPSGYSQKTLHRVRHTAHQTVDHNSFAIVFARNMRTRARRVRHVYVLTNISEAHVLQFHEFVDAVLGALATQARLLDSAHRYLDRRQQTFVDGHHTVVESLRHAPALSDVTREDVA